jgi:hypothetical protein
MDEQPIADFSFQRKMASDAFAKRILTDAGYSAEQINDDSMAIVQSVLRVQGQRSGRAFVRSLSAASLNTDETIPDNWPASGIKEAFMWRKLFLGDVNAREWLERTTDALRRAAIASVEGESIQE